MKLIIILLITCNNCWSQIPEIIKSGDSMVVKIDTSIVKGDTTYYMSKGWFSKGEKNGVWHYYYKNSSDTINHYRSIITYKNGKFLSRLYYEKNSYTKTLYSNTGDPNEFYRYLSNGSLLEKEIYSGPNKKYVTIYHSNGKLQATGYEKLVKITKGCDMGMMVFQRYGKWKYYDPQGNRTKVKYIKINKYIFKEVHNKV